MCIYFYVCFVVVQSLNYIWLFTTAAHQASLSFSISQCLLKLLFFESVMPSKHLILCYPLLLLPSIFPSIRVFLVSQFFSSGGQSIGASTSASVLLMNIQDWFPLGLTGLISLLCKRFSRIFRFYYERHSEMFWQSLLKAILTRRVFCHWTFCWRCDSILRKLGKQFLYFCSREHCCDGPGGRSTLADMNCAEAWLRGATPCPRSGAASDKSYPMTEIRGIAWDEQPHVQEAVAVQAQEGQGDLLHLQGREGRLWGDTPRERLGAVAVLCWSSGEEIPHVQGRRNPSKMVGVARGQTHKQKSQKTSQSNHMDHRPV